MEWEDQYLRFGKVMCFNSTVSETSLQQELKYGVDRVTSSSTISDLSYSTCKKHWHSLFKFIIFQQFLELRL